MRSAPQDFSGRVAVPRPCPWHPAWGVAGVGGPALDTRPGKWLVWEVLPLTPTRRSGWRRRPCPWHPPRGVAGVGATPALPVTSARRMTLSHPLLFTEHFHLSWNLFDDLILGPCASQGGWCAPLVRMASRSSIERLIVFSEVFCIRITHFFLPLSRFHEVVGPTSDLRPSGSLVLSGR